MQHTCIFVPKFFSPSHPLSDLSNPLPHSHSRLLSLSLSSVCCSLSLSAASSTKVLDNTCGKMAFINGPEKNNVAAALKQGNANYTTFYAGKYLNTYGTRTVGGVKRIPPGWDQWYGLVGNSKYYEYTVSNNGVAEKHGSDYHKDYFTDRVANRSLEFMATALEQRTPFFMMVATPASHGPNTPAPQYAETYVGVRGWKVVWHRRRAVVWWGGGARGGAGWGG